MSTEIKWAIGLFAGLIGAQTAMIYAFIRYTISRLTKTFDEHIKTEIEEKKEILVLVDKITNKIEDLEKTLYKDHIMRLDKTITEMKVDIGQIQTAINGMPKRKND